MHTQAEAMRQAGQEAALEAKGKHQERRLRPQARMPHRRRSLNPEPFFESPLMHRLRAGGSPKPGATSWTPAIALHRMAEGDPPDR